MGVNPKARALELYRRGRWQYSVLEEPEARACGHLPGVSEEVDFGTAEAALLDLVEETYGVRYIPQWQQTDTDWWVAELEN